MEYTSSVGWLAVGVVAVGAIGAVRLLDARSRLARSLNYVVEFRQRLEHLMGSQDRNVYEWLTMNANRMQVHLGGGGIMTFRPPFANYVVHNYPVVLNVLAELRKCFSDSTLARGDLPSQYHALLDDALLRHEGTVRELHRRNSLSLRNPLKWLPVGASWLLALPVWLLESFGLVSHSAASRIESSRIFRLISSVAALLAFVSAIVGLVTGWEPFLAILHRVAPNAF